MDNDDTLKPNRRQMLQYLATVFGVDPKSFLTSALTPAVIPEPIKLSEGLTKYLSLASMIPRDVPTINNSPQPLQDASFEEVRPLILNYAKSVMARRGAINFLNSCPDKKGLVSELADLRTKVLPHAEDINKIDEAMKNVSPIEYKEKYTQAVESFYNKKMEQMGIPQELWNAVYQPHQIILIKWGEFTGEPNIEDIVSFLAPLKRGKLTNYADTVDRSLGCFVKHFEGFLPPEKFKALQDTSNIYSKSVQKTVDDIVKREADLVTEDNPKLPIDKRAEGYSKLMKGGETTSEHSASFSNKIREWRKQKDNQNPTVE